jgi:FkbM family methyltransferase
MNIIKLGICSVKSRGFFKTLAYAVPLFLINNYLLLARRRIAKKISKQVEGGFIIKEIAGSKMYLDIYGEGLPRDLIIDGVREYYVTERMKKEIKEGDVIVDIGANIGYYALLEARLVGEKGVVYAIEPVPENVELLEKNIRLNNYSNIKVFQLAAGNRIGTARMYISEQCNLSSMTNIAGKPVKRIEEVEITTLDEFLRDKPYPDMIRMDVEGYECEVVEGMKETLKLNGKKPLKLFVEFHFHLIDKQQSIDLLTTLKEHGFEITDVIIEKKGVLRYKKLLKLLCLLQKRMTGVPTAHGHLSLTIDQIIRNRQILNGEWGGGLAILFER